MAAPPFDINAPDPGAASWGPEITATRDNITRLMIAAASVGNELPNWNTVFDYTSGDLDFVEMTYQADTSIKMKWVHTYSGGSLQDTKWYFDKGLGAGHELITGGTLTKGYTTGKITSITSS